MMISGYNQRERYCAIKGAIERYNQLQQDVKNGSRECLYRSGNQIREQKAQKKDWSNTWFLKNEVRSTVSCPTTPGSSLKRSLSKAINGDTNPTVQVIEDGGVPVYIGLLRPNPMKPVGCTFGDDRCMVDRSQNCDKA